MTGRDNGRSGAGGAHAKRGRSPREAWAERPPYLAGRETATRRRKSPLPAAAFACEAKRPSTTASHGGLTPKVNHRPQKNGATPIGIRASPSKRMAANKMRGV